MSNPIKYSTGSETLALKKGNFYIGTGDVGKGPTSSTGYYNGITPPSGGYTIYLNKETGGPSIYTVSNDTQLISLTNSIAGQSYTGVQQCFDYFYGQTDKVLVNQDYPADYPYIVMDGLVLNLDAGITQSYPGSGTVWTDVNGLGPKNNGTLTNGPTFSSDGGGSIVFDTADDYVPVSGMENYEYTDGITVSVWHYNGGSIRYRGVVTNGDFTGDRLGGFDLRYGRENYFGGENNGTILRWRITTNEGIIFLGIYANINEWHNYVGTFNNTISKTYKDGEFWNSGSTTTSQLKTKTSSTTIGLSPTTSEYLDGKLSNVQIYNRALSAQEVLQNYNAQKGRFGL
jgi:hypothetical protein